ncbi:hypothetical protein GLOIN_2v1880126 [Rhizophagus clarus]|uniref:Uncharacterized protein n=1 Tax=Rhizophagus clarus TaxID=94130 RepID=A0A8H3M302_9GLOM|nr:hypothetical protein GLOIN_2v1880126 [Rhizophagus clarus]
MSSYKTDAITQEPHLQDNKYIYCENLGGLCLIYNTYGYKTFDELTKLIQNHVSNLHIQNQLLDQGEKLKRYLKREYESHLTVNSDGTTAHNQFINHYFLFAFDLDKKGAIIIVDYKMKILSKSARETKSAFLEKKISHAINHYVQLGFNINEGVDIENAIQGICDTSVAHLKPEQKRAKIAQFEKKPLEKPNLQVSDHSIPTSNWNMPLPHKSRINTSRLNIEELKKQLKKYGIDTDISNNRIVLAEILQNKLNDKISQQNMDVLNTEIIDTNLGSRQVLNHTFDFTLPSGWVLKENQKFDINKSEKYTAQEMHNKLKGLVKKGVLEEKKIPKISTISNWIARYA